MLHSKERETGFHEKVVFVKPDVAGSLGAPRYSLQKTGIRRGRKKYPASTTPLPHLVQASKKPPKNIWGFFDAK